MMDVKLLIGSVLYEAHDLITYLHIAKVTGRGRNKSLL